MEGDSTGISSVETPLDGNADKLGADTCKASRFGGVCRFGSRRGLDELNVEDRMVQAILAAARSGLRIQHHQPFRRSFAANSKETTRTAVRVQTFGRPVPILVLWE